MVELSKELVPESPDRAQSKVDVQRDKIARMAPDDPHRPAEERVLDVMIDNAQLADTAHVLLDQEPSRPKL